MPGDQERMTSDHAELARKLTDRGLLIEAGWMSYLYVVLPKNASDVQIRETRKAFFAGAQHLFATMLTVLEPGTEATDNDLNRMTQINEELERFLDELRKHVVEERE